MALYPSYSFSQDASNRSPTATNSSDNTSKNAFLSIPSLSLYWEISTRNYLHFTILNLTF